MSMRYGLYCCLILFMQVNFGFTSFAKEQRIAVISTGEKSSQLADLVLIKLSEKNIDVLEREKINAVLKERQLNTNFSYKNAVIIGKLLSANFFAVISNKRAIVYETRFGIRLADFLLESNDMDKMSSDIAMKILQVFAKFDNFISGKQRIIAFAPSRSVALLGKKLNDFQTFLSLLKRAMINQKEIIVVERTHLSALLKERSLIDKNAGKKILNSSLLLDIEAAHSNQQNGIDMNIWLQTLQNKVIYRINTHIVNDKKLPGKTRDISALISLKISSLSDKFFSKEKKQEEAVNYYSLWKTYYYMRKCDLALLAIQNAYALDEKYFDDRVGTECVVAAVRFSRSKKTLHDKKNYVNTINQFVPDLKKMTPKKREKILRSNVSSLNQVQTNDEELKRQIEFLKFQFVDQLLMFKKQIIVPEKIKTKQDFLIVLERMKQIRKLITNNQFHIKNLDLWIKYMQPLWEKLLIAPNLHKEEFAGVMKNINIELFISKYLVKSFWFLNLQDSKQKEKLIKFKIAFINSPTPFLAAMALQAITHASSCNKKMKIFSNQQILDAFKRISSSECKLKTYRKRIQDKLRGVQIDFYRKKDMYNIIRDKYGIILSSFSISSDYREWQKKSLKLLAKRKKTKVKRVATKATKKRTTFFEEQNSESPFDFVKLFKNEIPSICMGKPLYRNNNFYIFYYSSDYYMYSIRKRVSAVRLFKIDINGKITKGKLVECRKDMVPKEKYKRIISKTHYIQAAKNGLILLPLDLSKPYTASIPEVKNRVPDRIVEKDNHIYLWYESRPFRLIEYDLTSNKHIVLYGQEQRMNNPFQNTHFMAGRNPLLVDDSGKYLLFIKFLKINWVFDIRNKTWHKLDQLKNKLSLSNKFISQRNTTYRFDMEKQKFVSLGRIDKFDAKNNYWYDVKGIKPYKQWTQSCDELKPMKRYNFLHTGFYVSKDRIINNCLVFLPASRKAFPLIGKYPYKQIVKKKYPVQKINNISIISDCGNYIMGKYQFRWSEQYYIAKLKSNVELEKLSLYIDTSLPNP